MLFGTDEDELRQNAKYPYIYLSKVDWNDYGYITGFYAMLNEKADSKAKEIGHLKIGKQGMNHDSYNKAYLEDPVSVNFPNSMFQHLDHQYFSVATDVDYYENLNKMGQSVAHEVLGSLNDVAFSTDAMTVAKQETVFTKALLRDVSIMTVESDFYNTIFDEQSKKRSYEIELSVAKEVLHTPVKFTVEPDSFPSSNLHVLIGRNGVGKSHFFKSLINSLSVPSKQKEIVVNNEPYFEEIKGLDNISSILVIGYSAFDTTFPRDERSAVLAQNKVRYNFIGLPEQTSHSKEVVVKDRTISRSTDVNWNSNAKQIEKAMTEEFKKVTAEILDRPSRKEMLFGAIQQLQSDPVFKDNKVLDWFQEQNEESRPELFANLSSGHTIVFLMVMEVVRHLENYSLILIDEPETHLHPPLLSSLIQTIETLLIQKNAIGIVVTHSPVVLQEVDSECVWILNRANHAISFKRPDIQTYGENLNTLLREVFKLEVNSSGFEQTIHDVVQKCDTIEDVRKKFNNRLSANAERIALIDLEMKSHDK